MVVLSILCFRGEDLPVSLFDHSQKYPPFHIVKLTFKKHLLT